MAGSERRNPIRVCGENASFENRSIYSKLCTKLAEPITILALYDRSLEINKTKPEVQFQLVARNEQPKFQSLLDVLRVVLSRVVASGGLAALSSSFDDFLVGSAAESMLRLDSFIRGPVLLQSIVLAGPTDNALVELHA